jgi:hypothetical protein
MVNMTAEGALQSNQVEKIFNNALDEAMKNSSTDVVASIQKLGLDNVQKVASTQKEVLGLHKGSGTIVFGSAVKMVGSNSKVMEAYQNMIGSVANKTALHQNQNIALGQRIGDVISQTAAVGNNEVIAGAADVAGKAGAAGKAGKISKKVIK